MRMWTIDIDRVSGDFAANNEDIGIAFGARVEHDLFTVRRPTRRVVVRRVRAQVDHHRRLQPILVPQVQLVLARRIAEVRHPLPLSDP